MAAAGSSEATEGSVGMEAKAGTTQSPTAAKAAGTPE